MRMNDIICWWSGGVTSAVACNIAVTIYGIERCRIIMIDTKNEDGDTYRFKADCEKWYGKEIEVITSNKYESIQDVWIKNKSLNVANGAVCSSELKRRVREVWQKENEYEHQVFGFDIDEPNRARSLKMNHSKTKPIFPLLMFGYSKKDCIRMLPDNIELPNMYKLGFHNNNCFKTGCVQGGIGYWQKMKTDFTDKFNSMAEMEHKLTELKGQPVTMLKDQSQGGGLVFLKPHSNYPHIKDISMMKGRAVEPLMDCNGLCGVNDLIKRNETEKEINYQIDLFNNL